MDTAPKTIHIKWVRSGIGFDRSQTEVVRSLGLRRLNQIVERPDTPQVRGLVAKVAHLVEVVSQVSEPVWASAPGYAIKPAASQPAAASGEGLSSPREAAAGATDSDTGTAGIPPAGVAQPVPGQASETPALSGEGATQEALSSQSEDGTHDKE
jgi:large subunit ribosomal protein L30